MFHDSFLQLIGIDIRMLFENACHNLLINQGI